MHCHRRPLETVPNRNLSCIKASSFSAFLFMYEKRAWMAAEAFAELFPRQGCAVLGPRAGLRVKFSSLVEGNAQPSDMGREKHQDKTPQERAKQSSARLSKHSVSMISVLNHTALEN